LVQPMPVTSLNAAMLQDSVERSVRVIALARLQRLLEEAARVEVRTGADSSPDTSDPEAIHDFRVALRRLRAWLRAFRPYFADTVRHGPERRLRTLSRLAGRARDLEVQCRWLAGLRRSRSTLVQDEARRLIGQVDREQARARRVLTKGLVTELPETAVELAEALRHDGWEIQLAEQPHERMAAVMADAVRQATDAVTADLRSVHRLDQIEEAHAARISIKRLRYLLEAFGRTSRSATCILAQLATLQHLFGELHDAQVLQRRLREPHGASPAAAALRARLARRAATAFRQARRAVGSAATDAMFTRLTAFIRRLERVGRMGDLLVPTGSQ